MQPIKPFEDECVEECYHFFLDKLQELIIMRRVCFFKVGLQYFLCFELPTGVLCQFGSDVFLHLLLDINRQALMRMLSDVTVIQVIEFNDLQTAKARRFVRSVQLLLQTCLEYLSHLGKLVSRYQQL